MVIELIGVQFWSEIILVISNRTRAARSFDFEITRMISDQIALHSVQLPLLMCKRLLLLLFWSSFIILHGDNERRRGLVPLGCRRIESECQQESSKLGNKRQKCQNPHSSDYVSRDVLR